MNELHGSNESNERRNSEFDVTELEAAYPATGLGEFFSELDPEEWQEILERTNLTMPNEVYYLESGPDFDAVLFRETSAGDLVVKRPSANLTMYQTEEGVRDILHRRAYAATLVADVSHFENTVAFSPDDMAIVTEFVDGKNLADLRDEEIAALSYEKLDSLAEAYAEGWERGVAMDVASAANFIDNGEEIVCVGYGLREDTLYESPADGLYEFAVGIVTTLRVGEKPDLAARQYFLSHMRVIAATRFPESPELQQKLAHEQERLQFTPPERW